MTGPLTKRYVALWTCFLASALFLVFQGGKVAFMIFAMVSILTVYLLMGRWNGIVKTEGERILSSVQNRVQLEAGNSLYVRLEFKIPGMWPIPYVIVNDRLVRKNGGTQTFEMTFIPDWKRRGDISYRTPPLRRGVYEFAETSCMTEDIFGLFRHKGTLTLPGKVRVLPQTVNIREWRHFNQLSRGIYYHSAHARALRETTQFNGVREYVYGDRISRIHWNASARTGVWKSKEFERESLPKMVLVLDAQASAFRTHDMFELGVSTAASLLQFGQRHQLSQGLVVTSKSTMVYAPTTDEKERQVMMDRLIGVEADGKRPLIRTIPELGVMPLERSFFVVITPQPPAALRPLKVWALQSQRMLCHIWLEPQGANISATDELALGADVNSDHIQAVKTYRVRTLEQLPQVLEGAG